jgi:hypothetical protein
MAIRPKEVLCKLDCGGYMKDFHISQSCKIKETKYTLLIYIYIYIYTHTHTVRGVCYNERCYNERCYNEWMLQRTVFINKIRILQWTQMLQRTRKNTINRRSTRVRMTCRTFPLWLERQSSSLLSLVRFSYQFISVVCLFASLAVKIFFL